MTDAELLQLLKTDPAQGCRILVQEYTGFVMSIARCRIGGICSNEELEELTSDVLFAFYQKREQLTTEKGSVRGLLATMTTRRCVDRYRKYAAQPVQTASLEEEQQTDPIGSILSPEEQYLQKERCQALISAINALGEPDRSIILWKYYFGETAAAIADRLSMRTGTVEMRISRAKAKLRKAMGGDDDDI